MSCKFLFFFILILHEEFGGKLGGKLEGKLDGRFWLTELHPALDAMGN